MNELDETGLEESNPQVQDEDVLTSPKSRLKQLLSINLQPNEEVLNEAIRLASDKNVRISKLSETVLKDPVITLEILALANSSSMTDERTSIAAVQTGVIRIGSKKLLKTLTSLKKRIRKDIDPDVAVEYSSLRRLSERASIVSEILSSHIQRDVIEISQTCALLSYIGPMILCTYLDREYLELAHLRKRNALAYRIQSRYGVHYNDMLIRYLKDRHLPSIIFYAFDRELKCKTTSQSSLRLIVESAIELVEAYEDGKWMRYGPGGNLPPKSNIRLLKISDTQFANIYDEIEYSLGISKPATQVEESIYPDTTINKSDNDPITGLTSAVEDESDLEENLDETEDDDKIQVIFDSSHDDDESSEDEEMSISSLGLPLDEEESKAPTVIVDRDHLMDLLSSGSAVFIEKTHDNLDYEKSTLSSEAQAILELIEFICKGAESSQSLLEELMSVITDQGPFSRSALIQISSTRETAMVKSAIGEQFSEIRPPVELFVEDPLSPLSTCATRVSSFNAKGIKDIIAPFGISSYAISPIKVNSNSTFVLYVDCGEHKPLPLEARKMFRLVVALLNKALPEFSVDGSRTLLSQPVN
jgi:hypothetical protein